MGLIAVQTSTESNVPDRSTPTRPIAGIAAATAQIPVGWALLQAEDDDALSVLVELAEGFPRATQGYGGWEEIDRRGGIALTSWAGFKPMTFELDLYIDDHAAGRSVERVCDILEALAGRGRRRTTVNGSYTRPPLTVVNTAGVMPHDSVAFPDGRWLVNNLDWDEDNTIVNDHGNRVRAPVTATLLQHVSDQRLQGRSRATAPKKKSRHRYTVKPGDTLQSIARHKLGDAGRWPEIARLNGLRDPRAVKPGAVLRLP